MIYIKIYFSFLLPRLQNKYLAFVASHTCTVKTYWGFFLKRIRITAIVFFLLVFNYSCTKTSVDFGTQFIDNSTTQVVRVDTFTVTASTIYLDSIITNNLSTGLAGVYTDPYFGIIKAKCFVSVQPPSSYSVDSFSNTTYDYAELVLHLKDSSYYGDTLKPLSLQVAQVADYIKPPTGTTYLYNTSSFPVMEGTVGSTTINLRPLNTDTISIPLNDELGNAWMNMLQQGNENIKSSEKFEEYFKGFCISSPGSDGPMIGFTDSVEVRVHYKKSGLFETKKYVTFPVHNPSYEFNSVSVDRAGTPLETISSMNNTISTTATGNMGFIQTLTNTAVRINFPNIKSIYDLPGYASLISVGLVVKPAKQSFSNIFSLPSNMRLSITDGANAFNGDLSYISGTTQVAQTGNLQVDNVYGINTYYSYDLTSYISSELVAGNITKDGLILSPSSPDFSTKFNRLIVGNDPSSDVKIQLVVYYLAVQ